MKVLRKKTHHFNKAAQSETIVKTNRIDYKIGLSQRTEFCQQLLYIFENFVSVEEPGIKIWSDIPKTQMTILIILKRVGILFESAFSLRISLKFYNICLKHFLRINLFTCKIQKPPEGFCKKSCYWKFRKIPSKTPAMESLFNKVTTYKISCKICENFKKTCFEKHLPRTASGHGLWWCATKNHVSAVENV